MFRADRHRGQGLTRQGKGTGDMEGRSPHGEKGLPQVECSVGPQTESSVTANMGLPPTQHPEKEPGPWQGQPADRKTLLPLPFSSRHLSPP